jgi:hypothetical protein
MDVGTCLTRRNQDARLDGRRSRLAAWIKLNLDRYCAPVLSLYAAVAAAVGSIGIDLTDVAQLGPSGC